MTVDSVQIPELPGPPLGVSFEFGWVMAQLFDRARFLSPYARDFNPSTQLPMISDLGPEQRQRMGVAELGELSALFPSLMEVADKVQASADADPLATLTSTRKSGIFTLRSLKCLPRFPSSLARTTWGLR